MITKARANNGKIYDVEIYPEFKTDDVRIYALPVTETGSTQVVVYGCEVEIKYADYKNKYSNLSTVRNSYNKDTKTIKVVAYVGIHEDSVVNTNSTTDTANKTVADRIDDVLQDTESKCAGNLARLNKWLHNNAEEELDMDLPKASDDIPAVRNFIIKYADPIKKAINRCDFDINKAQYKIKVILD